MRKVRQDAQKFINGVPMNLEIVNTGSTFSLYGFDYRYFQKRGFNFAAAPQPLSRDLKILERYKRRIAENAVVVIAVACPFEFSVYSYGRSREFLPRFCSVVLKLKKPFTLVKSIIKKLMEDDAKRPASEENTPENVKKAAEARISGWKRQFNLPNVRDCRPDEKLRATFEKSSDALRGMLDLCFENKFRPVIVSMPVCKEESEEFSASFIEEFYNKNLRRANVYNVPVIDYFRDERFHDHSLYINADCFNGKGREFFAKVFTEDLKKLGLWEPSVMGEKYFRLRNGIKIPSICFGTNITLPPVFIGETKEILQALFLHFSEFVRSKSPSDWGKRATFKATRTLIPLCREALLRGITAFDCARAYGGSERRLGIALKNHSRSGVFVITKIDDSSQFLGRVEECFAQSLEQLGTDYVDLLLLHWPADYPPFPDERYRGKNIPVYVRSWKVLEKIYESGRAKAIGVANFTIKHLEELKKYSEVIPMVNEFECHPLCVRTQLNDYCRQNGIQVLAYAALCGMDQRLRGGTIAGIAEKHNKSSAQIILRWHNQNGRIPIFGTSKKERMTAYADIFDFTLSEKELEAINGCNVNYRAFPDSEQCDFTKGIWAGWEKYKDCCP